MTAKQERAKKHGPVFSFECWVVGTDWHQTVTARTAGRAKYEYWRDVRESWESVKFTDVRVKKLGRPVTGSEFLKVARYRGLPEARIGMRCRAEGMEGIIVGHNSCANFDVLFDGYTFPMNVHPHGLELLVGGARHE